ncbi:ABC transporter permease [Nannocystaceae bacterium ST9]
MFRRLMTMVRKDVRTGSRDQIVLYMLCSPLLLGLGLAAVMPVLERAVPGFAVDPSLSEDRIAALAEFGAIERLESRAAVERRVLERDDVVGVVGLVGAGPGPRDYEVLVEGDEAEPLRRLPAAILEHGIDPPPVASGPSEVRKISTALMAYAIVVITGLMIGFAILEEKQTETHRVYAVSPLRFAEYLIGKLGLGLVLSLALVSPAVALAIGPDVDWLGIVLITLAALPFGLSLGLIIGVQAKDQLGAIAVMKALMPIWTSVPILGFVLPSEWLWTQWPFPNHWCVQGFYHALGDATPIGGHALAGLLAGIPILVGVAWLLRRRLGFGE